LILLSGPDFVRR